MHTSSLGGSARSCQARSQPHKPAATTKSAPLLSTVTEEEPSSSGGAVDGAVIVLERRRARANSLARVLLATVKDAGQYSSLHGFGFFLPRTQHQPLNNSHYSQITNAHALAP